MITRWEKHRFVDRVGDEHYRQVLLLPETQQVAVEFVTRNFIQRAEGLIHQQQLWSGDRAAGDGDAHLHAAGEFARQDVGGLPRPTSSRTSFTRVLPSARGTRPDPAAA